MMNRTFQHKISVQSLATLALLAACALLFFLNRTGLMPLFGMMLLLLGAAAVDRMIHSEYVITPDDRLVISRGRLSKPLVINIDEIVAVRPVRGALLIAPHVIIEYGAGHITSVQPADANGFIKEIKRRLK